MNPFHLEGLARELLDNLKEKFAGRDRRIIARILRIPMRTGSAYRLSLGSPTRTGRPHPGAIPAIFALLLKQPGHVIPDGMPFAL
jgi:hypothetical protein